MTKNIKYSLIENNNRNINFTHEELLNEVMDKKCGNNNFCDNNDYFLMLQLNYKENFLKKELERIADYYQISKRKKKKDELINDIIIYELNPDNEDIVHKRKTMWFYMEEILKDNYLSKFFILD
jgi:hypothetical protein